MLSYRHLFHAGNFSDVFKHVLLAQLLQTLNRKDKPWCYLDTHAGIARYDLTLPWAQKAREFENGITRLWGRQDLPEAIKPWMALVKAENTGRKLRYYPGSPLVARGLARPGDRLVLTELNPADFEELESVFNRDRQAGTHQMDGYQALKAFLPPAERRGLVLIDSSFDRSREFPRIVRALKEAHQRWATGIYAVWYPLMDPPAMRAFNMDVLRADIRDIIKLEIRIKRPDETQTIPGCGMLVVNPPFRFEQEARPLLDWLWRVLAVDGAGGVTVERLVKE